MRTLLIAFGVTTNPIGLQSIYYFLKHKGHVVDFIHLYGNIQNLRTVKNKPDVVGVTCNTANRYRLKEVLLMVRDLWPRTKIVLGGRHFHKDVLEMESEKWLLDIADHIVIGEGEYALHSILDGYAEDQIIEGLLLPQEYFDKICIPEPWFISKYMMARPEKKQPAVLFSRGCPFNCYFCSESREVIRVSPDQAAAHISDLENYFGWKQIFIYDDIFGMNYDWLVYFNKGLRERNVKTNFRVFIHGNTLDETLLDLFLEIGVNQLSLGAESGDNRILRAINKKTTIEDYIRTHNLVYPHRDKILLHCLWMIGNIEETEESLKATYELSQEIGTDDNPFFGYAIPFPGSYFWRNRETFGRVVTYNWSKWNNRNIIFVPNGLSSEQLKYWKEKGKSK